MSEQPTTERTRETGPLTLSPPISARQQQARSNHRVGLILGIAGLALTAGVLFSVFGPHGLSKDQRPIETVQQFVAATQARDVSKMLSYVEPTVYRREIGPEVRLYMAYIDSISFTDARYEILKDDGNIAQVRWTCIMNYTLRGRGSEQRSMDTTFELVQIEGAWYLRNIRLPSTS